MHTGTQKSQTLKYVKCFNMLKHISMLNMLTQLMILTSISAQDQHETITNAKTYLHINV